MEASAYFPIILGAVLGAVGTVLFIMRSRAFPKEDRSQGAFSRQSAVRRVLVIYATVAWICLAAAVFIGNIWFIILTGVIVVIASVGLLGFWSAKS